MQTTDPGGNGQGPTTTAATTPTANNNSYNNGSTSSPKPHPAGSWASLKASVLRWRGSRKLVLVIVAIALLLDNMLLTVVVPIIPEFLYDIRHPDAPLASFPKTPPTTLSPCEKETTTPYNGIDVTTPGYDNASWYAEREERHKELVEETVEVGLMFASKAFVQLLANPIVGPLTHKIGYSIPMFAGFVIMFISTLSKY